MCVREIINISVSEFFLCYQENDKFLRFSVFFHVEYCLKMFYQFLKLTLNVEILSLEKIFCEKKLFMTLNH